MRLLLDRRSFLRAAGVGALAALGPERLAQAQETDALFAAAFGRRSGGHGVAVLDERGRLLHAFDLPARGHDIAFDPASGRAVVFARQPGVLALVFDPAGREGPQAIASAPGRHFFGHGAFSLGGKLLFATENDFEAARGVIGVYDATGGFGRLGEFPSGGVGPHELLLLPDGETLAVANGGVETHPDWGRAELNLHAMRPSLAFVHAGTGELLENHVLPPELRQLSIRHLDAEADGTVWFGCQHKGSPSERPQLLGRARQGRGIELVGLRDDALLGLKNYVGSVAVNRAAGLVAISSPQGNRLLTVEAKSGLVVGERALREVCGVAPAAKDFVASTGLGAWTGPGGEAEQPELAWDNHILRLA